MIEVKSATSVKPHCLDDAAIQAYVAKAAGVALAKISLAYIDKSWVYPGNNNFQGLLIENDIIDEALLREEDVKTWIAQGQKLIQKRQ